MVSTSFLTANFFACCRRWCFRLARSSAQLTTVFSTRVARLRTVLVTSICIATDSKNASAHSEGGRQEEADNQRESDHDHHKQRCKSCQRVPPATVVVVPAKARRDRGRWEAQARAVRGTLRHRTRAGSGCAPSGPLAATCARPGPPAHQRATIMRWARDNAEHAPTRGTIMRWASQSGEQHATGPQASRAPHHACPSAQASRAPPNHACLTLRTLRATWTTRTPTRHHYYALGQ